MTKVELYTSRGCGACVNAKRMFDSKKVPYEEIRLGSSRRVDTEYQIRTNGSKTVPQIFINGEWIGGFEELLKFEKAGELDWRLGLCERPNRSFLRRFLRKIMGRIY